MATKWVNRWRYNINPHPVLPGVWRRKEGGFVVRGRTTDPTGRRRELLKPVPVETADEARAFLLRELEAIRRPPAAETPTERKRFDAYATSLLERRVRDGSIRSAATRQKWGTILEKHLFPAFGTRCIADLRRADVLAWRDAVAVNVADRAPGQPRVKGAPKTYTPTTANDWLALLRVVVGAYVLEHELDRDPTKGVPDFDRSTHATYTDEEPNSLTPDEARAFLAAMCRLFPQHYAMTAVGFATGLRPSSLRPLRRSGPARDFDEELAVLRVRRSQVLGDEVMGKTKTGLRQTIALPPELVDVLRWHVARLPEGKQGDSELLFPAVDGGFRARSVLDKPFAAVAKAIALGKRLTPRGMRRTFQDLARAANVTDLVTRSISGHATEEMQRHYSTVPGDEQRGALAAVVNLADFKGALAGAPAPRPEGVKKGVKTSKATGSGSAIALVSRSG